jgi:hypothetical protein
MHESMPSAGITGQKVCVTLSEASVPNWHTRLKTGAMNSNAMRFHMIEL